LDDPRKWRDWAVNAIRDPNVSIYSPPNPYDFLDWREWAFRFNQAVPLD
jgi:hypothetical protein